MNNSDLIIRLSMTCNEYKAALTLKNKHNTVTVCITVTAIKISYHLGEVSGDKPVFEGSIG